MNTCDQCLLFHVIRIPTGNGNTRATELAHCLGRTIYAANKPGHPVYPVKAKVEELPHAQHHIVIVRKGQPVGSCQLFQRKEGK